MRRARLVAPFLIPVLAAFALGGCATAHYIPGTTVADKPINREILQVLERYRHAIEDKDSATLLSLAAPDYYEDSGTPKGDDDYGYAGLKQVIKRRMAALKTVRYRIDYRKIDVDGTRAHADIRYDATFQLATEVGDRWERKENDKRIELEKDKGRWLIQSGM